jgi:hypothetical protein
MRRNKVAARAIPDAVRDQEIMLSDGSSSTSRYVYGSGTDQPLA